MRRRTTRRVLVALPAVVFAWLAYVYLTLPDVRSLRETNPTTTAFMELRADEARGRGEKPRRVHRWMPYARISSSLKRAVLVAEDSGFWDHEGIDVEQIRESIEMNLERREFARGASTITQQLAKNLYLSPSRSPLRKLRELIIARRLEAALSKTRILELYLNVIEWGDGVYGAEAAAQMYFQKPASALSGPESALLAAAIINPRRFSPARPSARLIRRQQLVLTRMGRVIPPPAVAAAPTVEVTPAIENVSTPEESSPIQMDVPVAEEPAPDESSPILLLPDEPMPLEPPVPPMETPTAPPPTRR